MCVHVRRTYVGLTWVRLTCTRVTRTVRSLCLQGRLSYWQRTET